MLFNEMFDSRYGANGEPTAVRPLQDQTTIRCTRCSVGVEAGILLVLSFLGAMVLCGAGCSPAKAPPAQGSFPTSQTQPPAPPHEALILQRIAGAGALVYEMHGKGACQPAVGARAILFKNQAVGDELVAEVRQLDRPLFVRFEKVQFSMGSLKSFDGATNLYGLSIDNADDEMLADLHNMPNLRELFLRDPNVTTRGLGFLATCHDLCHLDLTKVAVGDDLIATLVGFPRLVKLGLSGTQITDTGLTEVSKLWSLSELNVSGCAITDVGIARLTALRQLRNLRVSKTGLTDAALSYIAELSNLEYLWLDGTAISDAGLSRLTPLKNLLVLNISGTTVTDAGLSHLRSLPALTYVYARGTRITQRSKCILPQVEYPPGPLAQ